MLRIKVAAMVLIKIFSKRGLMMYIRIMSTGKITKAIKLLVVTVFEIMVMANLFS